MTMCGNTTTSRNGSTAMVVSDPGTITGDWVSRISARLVSKKFELFQVWGLNTPISIIRWNFFALNPDSETRPATNGGHELTNRFEQKETPHGGGVS
jgi:hypothetical protein